MRKVQQQMKIRADLHIHTKYASSTSPDASIENIAATAVKKGVDLISSGDCLHPENLNLLRTMPFENGIFQLNGIHLVLGAEIEDINGAHHLLFFPNIDAVIGFRGMIGDHSLDLDTEGRPKVDLFPRDIAVMAKQCRASIGPAHYFTPFKGALAIYGGMRETYREMEDYVDFIELGLSADTDIASPIQDLDKRTFLSNSDSHSHHPRRIGREYNLLEMGGISYGALMDVLRSRKKLNHPGLKGWVVANYGLPPEEGRYNRTACSSCYDHYNMEEARRIRLRCPCGGNIKWGVVDIARKNYGSGLGVKNGNSRPPYNNILPIHDILSEITGKPWNSRAVSDMYSDIISIGGSELDIITSGKMLGNYEDRVRANYPMVIIAAERLRSGQFKAIPGGGGRYGEIRLLDDIVKRSEADTSSPAPSPSETPCQSVGRRGQKGLFDF